MVDDGGTANGGVDTDPTANTITFNVTPVNDAPSGADKTITLDEDTTHTFTATDFGLTDPTDSPAHTLSGVVITTLPANGALTLNGVAVTAGQVISAAQIGNLGWRADTNANGMGLASFTFKVVDDGGTANGGVDTDPVANTITFNVTPVNDAPVIPPLNVTPGEDSPLNGALFTASADPDGDVVQVTDFTFGGQHGTPGQPLTVVPYGTLTINPDGSYLFVPAPNYAGPVPQARFTVSDGNGSNLESTMTFADIVNVPDAPVLPSNLVLHLGPNGGTGTIDARDGDGGPLTFELISGPSYGDFTLTPEGAYRFAPYPGAFGDSTIVIRVTDDTGQTTTFTVPVFMAEPAPVPVAPDAIRNSFLSLGGTNMDSLGIKPQGEGGSLGMTTSASTSTGVYAQSLTQQAIRSVVNGLSQLGSITPADTNLNGDVIHQTVRNIDTMVQKTGNGLAPEEKQLSGVGLAALQNAIFRQSTFEDNFTKFTILVEVNKGLVNIHLADPKTDQGTEKVYMLDMADGTPTPKWLERAGPQTFTGKPERAETLDMMVTVIGEDGKAGRFPVQVDTSTGQVVRMDKPLNQTGNAQGIDAPSFTQQLQNQQGPRTDIQSLERALGFE